MTAPAADPRSFSAPSVAAGTTGTRAGIPSTTDLPRVLVLTLGTLGVVALGLELLGAPLSQPLLILWGGGALLAAACPTARRVVAIGVGAAALALLHPRFSLYFLALLLALLASHRKALPFAGALLAAAIVWPKLAFIGRYHQPTFWSWLHEPSLALALFAGALWLRTRAGARRDGGTAVGDDPLSFLLMFLLPTQVTHPMVIQPVLLAQPPRIDTRAMVTQLGWWAVKVGALLALAQLDRTVGPVNLANLAPHHVLDLSRAQLWLAVATSYVRTYLMLAAAQDVPILVARLYGFALPAPFRAPLLACSPVELWRRWGIYNRKFLLDLVYFPLGGRRHQYRNVVLTFLASALIMHSGWFGSKYLEVGVGGWRDQSLYFLLQAAAVCACLFVWNRRGVCPPATLSLLSDWTFARLLGVVATQAWSALVHVLILAQGLSLLQRGHLVARCLGLGRH